MDLLQQVAEVFTIDSGLHLKIITLNFMLVVANLAKLNHAKKSLKMAETLAHRYPSDSTIQ